MIYALTDPTCGHTIAATTHPQVADAARDLLWCAGRTDIDITPLPDTAIDDLAPATIGCPACAARYEASMAAIYRRDLIRAADTCQVDVGALVDYFTSLTATTCAGAPVFDAHAAHHAAQAALEQGLIPACVPVVLEPAMFGEPHREDT